MKNAFVCCTPFHVIVTLQMVNTLFIDDQNDIFISDHFASAEKVFRNLKEESKNISNIANVFFVKDKEISYDKSFLKHKKIKSFLFDDPQKYLGEQLKKDYDSLNLFTHSFFTNLLVNHSFKNNKELSINFVEEGRMSYVISSEETKNRIKKIINKVISPFGFRFFNITLANRLYLFQPELYVGDFKKEIKKIPPISKSGILKNTLNNVFDYKSQPEFSKAEYIFFDQSFSIDGDGRISEYTVIEDLSNLLNHKATIIKLHPRDALNKYDNLKLMKVNNANLPWELIYLNEEISSDKKFIAINSSALFTAKLIFNQDHDIIVLKDLYQYSDVMLDKFIQKIRKSSINAVICTPNSLNELREILSKYTARKESYE